MPTITLTITTDAAGNVVGVGFQPATESAAPVAKRGPGRSRKQAQLELPLATEENAQ